MPLQAQVVPPTHDLPEEHCFCYDSAVLRVSLRRKGRISDISAFFKCCFRTTAVAPNVRIARLFGLLK